MRTIKKILFKLGVAHKRNKYILSFGLILLSGQIIKGEIVLFLLIGWLGLILLNKKK